MILKKWKDISDNIKNEYTYKYYKKLEKRKLSLLMKRIFDIIMSLILLIILLPIFVIVAICIKIDSKGPIFYKQKRVTQYDRTFKIFKFRTMVQDADKIGSLVTVDKDPRITRVGNVIRKFRIDEIPQLLNILIGDMSFVGTRPEVRKYVDKYSDEMKATLLMPAGVTSLASIEFKDEDEIISKSINKEKTLATVGATSDEIINESNETKNERTIDEIYVEDVLPRKMKYNLEYIEKFSILKDIKICVKTVIGVLR